MSKFRKKPVVIEARLYDGDNADEILNWITTEGGKATYHPYIPAVRSATGFVTEGAFPACISINTLEGDMFANEGEWIIRGIAGEFYACKPEIFAETYEPVSGCEECGGDLVTGNHELDCSRLPLGDS